ncbi:MAG: cysteine desulfurase-like protein [Firmicutes bacterium]|nr:cysteine desulfurase-like protein [Bacillota bacterium]MDH7496627.1 cysteine desulfurase-like protein [Bacillota bacterium]
MHVDLSFCRREFPALSLHVNGQTAAYFDGPGGTQVPIRVIEAVERYYKEANANSHGEFATSRRTDEIIAAARQAMANMLGAASADEIAFGANMTTLNFALSRALGRTLTSGDEIVITDLDHEANRSPWQALAERGVVVRSVRVKVPECTLDYDDLERTITTRTKIVALGYASNAVGTINDVKRASSLAHAVGAVCVVDAVHYAPHGAIDVQDIGCDFLLCSAYKFFGPHIGVLYGRREAFERLAAYKVRPQNSAPPYKIETGTLNFEGIAGAIQAVEFIASLGTAPGTAVQSSGNGGAATTLGKRHDLAFGGSTHRSRILDGMRAIDLHERQLFSRLMEGLAAIPGLTVYGLPACAERTPTVSFTVEGERPVDVARFLGDRGIFVWHGDFYATTLIERLGLAERGGVVRVGLAPYNTDEEVDRLLSTLEECSRRRGFAS